MLIDTHAHLYEKRMGTDMNTLAASFRNANVQKVICVGCDLRTSERSIQIAKSLEGVYATVGFHPNDSSKLTDILLCTIRELAAQPEVVAIGEIGLDYYRNHTPKDIQKYWFERQMELAVQLDMPIVIHCREAMADTLEIVSKFPSSRGVFHCYGGSVESLKNVLELGYYISLGGIVTFHNARVPVAVAAAVPLDRLVLETDCPYLAPEPYRGKTNSPAYIPEIAKKIAQIKGVSLEEIAAATTENAVRLFELC